MNETDNTFTELEAELMEELRVRQQEDAIIETAFIILQKRAGLEPVFL